MNYYDEIRRRLQSTGGPRPRLDVKAILAQSPMHSAHVFAKVAGGRVHEVRVMQPNPTQIAPYRWVDLGVVSTSFDSWQDAERQTKLRWNALPQNTRQLLLVGAADPSRDAQLANGGMILRDPKTGVRWFVIDDETYARMKKNAPFYKRIPHRLPLEPSWCNPTPPIAPTLGGFGDRLRSGYYCHPEKARPYQKYWMGW